MSEEIEYYVSGERMKKSFNFLYPLLGFSKTETENCDSFLYWTEVDNSIENYNIIVFFKTIYDEKFRKFERDRILTRNNLISCFEVEGGFIYIFDLIEYSDDISEFLEGNYSRFKITTKNKILNFFGSEKDKEVKPGKYHHMVLFPALYRSVVANELGVDEDILQELTEKYNLKDEVCEIKLLEDCECREEKLTYYNI